MKVHHYFTCINVAICINMIAIFKSMTFLMFGQFIYLIPLKSTLDYVQLWCGRSRYKTRSSQICISEKRSISAILVAIHVLVKYASRTLREFEIEFQLNLFIHQPTCIEHGLFHGIFAFTLHKLYETIMFTRFVAIRADELN